MGTWYRWASVLALCVSPALAQARTTGHDRGDGRGHRSGERHAQRRESRHASRERSDHHARSRRDSRSDHSRSYDRGWRSSQRSRHDDRPWSDSERSRHDDRRWRSSQRSRHDDRRWRDSERSRHDDRRWRDSERSRHDDRRWRSSYRSVPHHGAPRRGGWFFRARPLRHPSYYRYGYFYGHGYYFPRYYDDWDGYSVHSSIRTLVEPAETEVYVDGYYAGVADDFDGLFQRLHVAPGRHEITLRLDGFQTWSAEVYAAPGSTLKLHHDMLPGPSGPEIEGPGAYEPAPGAYGEAGPYEEPY